MAPIALGIDIDVAGNLDAVAFAIDILNGDDAVSDLADQHAIEALRGSLR